MSKYLYQPGDAVCVRSDLSVDTVYAMKSGDDTTPHWLAIGDMSSFAGKVVHIEKMLGGGCVRSKRSKRFYLGR